jgi:CubicO group peptidase (beta-lactamase class C family)
VISRRDWLRATGAAVALAPSGGYLAAAQPMRSTAEDWQWARSELDDRRAELLDAVVQQGLSDKSVSVLLLLNGRIAAEGYASGVGPQDRFQLASAAKSIVALLVGIAIDRGHIDSVEQSAADFLPAWRDTPKEAVRIRHLLSMTSGMTDGGLKARNVSGDQLRINAAAPLRYQPGTHWEYASAIYHLLFHLIAAATKMPFETFARTALLEPLGMQGFEWITDMVETEHGIVTNYYTGACPARDLARLGVLVENGGIWNGRPIVSPAYLESCLSPSQRLNPSYGWLWWSNHEPGHAARPGEFAYRFPGAPRDTVAALGAGGQTLVIVPSESLVLVRQGRRPSDPGLINKMLGQALEALA